MTVVAATKKELTADGQRRIEAALAQLAADKERFWRTMADVVYVQEEATFEDVGRLVGLSKNTAQKYTKPYKPESGSR